MTSPGPSRRTTASASTAGHGASAAEGEAAAGADPGVDRRELSRRRAEDAGEKDGLISLPLDDDGDYNENPQRERSVCTARFSPSCRSTSCRNWATAPGYL